MTLCFVLSSSIIICRLLVVEFVSCDIEIFAIITDHSVQQVLI